MIDVIALGTEDTDFELEDLGSYTDLMSEFLNK